MRPIEIFRWVALLSWITIGRGSLEGEKGLRLEVQLTFTHIHVHVQDDNVVIFGQWCWFLRVEMEIHLRKVWSALFVSTYSDVVLFASLPKFCVRLIFANVSVWLANRWYSRVDVRPYLFNFRNEASLHLSYIRDVEDVNFKVKRLWHFHPSIVLFGPRSYLDRLAEKEEVVNE